MAIFSQAFALLSILVYPIAHATPPPLTNEDPFDFRNPLPPLPRLTKSTGPPPSPGQILVLNSTSVRTAHPDLTVGCISNTGRFIYLNRPDERDEDLKCGEFRIGGGLGVESRIESKTGNCTWRDENMERNENSAYGKDDFAWVCKGEWRRDSGDVVYTIDGLRYPLLCNGDFNCFFDAPRFPSPGDQLPLWQYRWGAQQPGITPGHAMVQLLWRPVKADEAEVKEL